MTFSDDLNEHREQIMQGVREASNAWANAMRAHKLAPPDPGFSRRLQALADAAATEQNAWQQAHDAGFLWSAVPGAEGAEPPYELRPGTGRRGPQELWERFDQTVAALNRAITGSEAAAVAQAFGEISAAAQGLAEAVARDDGVVTRSNPAHEIEAAVDTRLSDSSEEGARGAA